jgi:ribosomal protein S18 acetylase RimI-like enzyme
MTNRNWPMSGATGDRMSIRPVRMSDVEGFRAMRLEAVRDYPLAFTADLAETQGRPLEWWQDLVSRNTGDGAASVIMVADAGDGSGELAGMTGLFSPPQPKLAHTATIWGVYVRPPFRGQGIGEQLLRACVDWARAKNFAAVKLSVVEGNVTARRCYERVGFAAYGNEPVAVQWENRFYNELLMAIRLK